MSNPDYDLFDEHGNRKCLTTDERQHFFAAVAARKISGRDPHLRPHIGWRAIGNVMAAMGTEGVQSTGEGNRELVK